MINRTRCWARRGFSSWSRVIYFVNSLCEFETHSAIAEMCSVSLNFQIDVIVVVVSSNKGDSLCLDFVIRSRSISPVTDLVRLHCFQQGALVEVVSCESSFSFDEWENIHKWLFAHTTWVHTKHTQHNRMQPKGNHATLVLVNARLNKMGRLKQTLELASRQIASYDKVRRVWMDLARYLRIIDRQTSRSCRF